MSDCKLTCCDAIKRIVYSFSHDDNDDVYPKMNDVNNNDNNVTIVRHSHHKKQYIKILL